MSRFPYWPGIPAGETNVDRFKELKEMGININLSSYPNADAMQKALDLAHEAGMKMVTSCPELKTDVEKTVKRFMDHPALAGYFLRDEPVVIAGGHSLWFKNYFLTYMPHLVQHDAKMKKITNSGAVSFTISRAEDAEGAAQYRIDPNSIEVLYGGFTTK